MTAEVMPVVLRDGCPHQRCLAEPGKPCINVHNGRPLNRIHAVREHAEDIQSARRGSRLMSTGEIAKRLLLSRQRVQQLTERATFPAPYDTLKVGRIWLRGDVEAWIAEYRPEDVR